MSVVAKPEKTDAPNKRIVKADEFVIVKVHFPLTFSVVLAIVVLVLSAIYWQESLPTKDNHQVVKDVLVFFSALAVAAATIASSYYTARTLGASIEAEERNTGLRKKLYAFEYGKRWNDPAMYHARDTLREILSHIDGHDHLIALANTKSTNVIHIFNFLDEMACVLNHGLADHDCVKNQFEYVVTSSWKKLSPWIQAHRKLREDDTIWEDLESLFDQWKRSTTSGV